MFFGLLPKGLQSLSSLFCVYNGVYQITNLEANMTFYLIMHEKEVFTISAAKDLLKSKLTKKYLLKRGCWEMIALMSGRV